MHEIKELTTTIFIHDFNILCGMGIDEVPVPVMRIHSNIFSEVSETIFRFEIRCGVISVNLDRDLFSPIGISDKKNR